MTWLLTSIILLMSFIPSNRILQVPEPYAISTYESIGVYAPYVGNKVSFRYRVIDGTWYQGMDMVPDYREMVMGINERFVPNKYKNEWRASIFRAQPDTEYEIELTYDDTTTKTLVTKTRSNVFPYNGRVVTSVDEALPGDTVEYTGKVLGGLDVTGVHGRQDAYIHIVSRGAELIGQGIVVEDSSYIVFTGFEINGARNGVKVLGDSHDIVFDSFYVHDVPFMGNPSNSFVIGQGSNSDVHSITVQYSYMEAAPGDPAGAVIHFYGTVGKHVIRHNTFEFKHRGVAGVHGSDCIAGYPNQGDRGSGHDNDFYGNRCIGATDDGIEFDGSARNVRVFDNHISGAMSGFAIAPISIGPGFLFNNTVDRPQRQWTNACHGIKSGESGDGHIFIYHNTFHMIDPSGSCVGRGLSSAGGGTDSPNTFILNNVFHVGDRVINVPVAQTPTVDHNLVYAERSGILYSWGSRNYRTLDDFRNATGQEQHSVYARPRYINEEQYDLRLISSPVEPKVLVGMNQIPRIVEVLEPAPIGAR